MHHAAMRPSPTVDIARTRACGRGRGACGRSRCGHVDMWTRGHHENRCCDLSEGRSRKDKSFHPLGDGGCTGRPSNRNHRSRSARHGIELGRSPAGRRARGDQRPGRPASDADRGRQIERRRPARDRHAATGRHHRTDRGQGCRHRPDPDPAGDLGFAGRSAEPAAGTGRQPAGVHRAQRRPPEQQRRHTKPRKV